MRILAVITLSLSVFLMACDKQEEAPASVAEPAAAAPTVEQAPAAPASSQVPAITDAGATETATQAQEAAVEQAQVTVEKTQAAVKQVEDKAAAVQAKAQYNAGAVVNPTYIEGTHYEVLPTPVKTITGNNVEVTEVFSYACIHCYHFEAVAKQWKNTMPQGAEFVQTPALFNKAWAYYARIFYTAKILDVLDPVHEEVFKAIHVQRNRLTGMDELAPIFAKAGVERDILESTFDSFGVTSQVQMADKRVREGFKTAGTPELIVDGRYRITSGLAGDHPTMFKVADFLVAKVKRERGL